MTGLLNGVFAALALGLIIYGVVLTAAVRSGGVISQYEERRLLSREGL
jgi:hypothetical protein